jgi:hypothetical protein
LRQAPLQSSFDSTTAPAFRPERLPTRVSALFATSLQCVYPMRGFPSPRCVPSSGDHSLSTVCSALQLVSLFRPTAAFRALPVQGFCRSAQPPSLFGRSCPHAVEARLAHRRIGCHKPSSSTSRLFSMQSRGSQGRRLDLAHDRSPHRVRCSSRRFPDRCSRFPRNKRSWRSPSESLTARTPPLALIERLQRFDSQESSRLVSETADLHELSSLPGTCFLSHVSAAHSRHLKPRTSKRPWHLVPHATFHTMTPQSPKHPRLRRAFDTSTQEPRHQESRRTPTPRLRRLSTRRPKELREPTP